MCHLYIVLVSVFIITDAVFVVLVLYWAVSRLLTVSKWSGYVDRVQKLGE